MDVQISGLPNLFMEKPEIFQKYKLKTQNYFLNNYTHINQLMIVKHLLPKTFTAKGRNWTTCFRPIRYNKLRKWNWQGGKQSELVCFHISHLTEVYMPFFFLLWRSVNLRILIKFLRSGKVLKNPQILTKILRFGRPEILLTGIQMIIDCHSSDNSFQWFWHCLRCGMVMFFIIHWKPKQLLFLSCPL